jgi:hypothetical protein
MGGAKIPQYSSTPLLQHSSFCTSPVQSIDISRAIEFFEQTGVDEIL